MSLFEEYTYENLVKSTLARIPSSLDKREGSMVYNGIAPTMAELAQLYIGLDFVFNATYIATAPREYLIERAKDRGLSPKAASAAVFRAELNVQAPLGARFSLDDLNFYISERMESRDTEDAFSFKLVCESTGALANDYTGTLIPVDYIDGLTSACLAELLVPGEDEEETEVFRKRIIESLKSQPFCGNQADYKEKVLDIDGVAAVKVQPVWNGDTPPSDLIPSVDVQAWFEDGMEGIDNTAVAEWLNCVYNAAVNKKLTVGGTVRLIIMAADGTAPSEELTETVQTAIDPTENAGEGMGLAPIGHVVRVDGVKETAVEVSTRLTLAVGWDIENARALIETAIDGYFKELSDEWERSDGLTVRVSQLESRILLECSEIVLDIGDTTLNGSSSNITLEIDAIPVRGALNVV